jgi:hypothetical protein
MERVRVEPNKKNGKGGSPLAVKGHKKVGGRQKGTPNKVNALWKDDLVNAADRLGRLSCRWVKVPGSKVKRLEWYGTGEGGQLGFIMSVICIDPMAAFNSQFARLLPLQLTGKDGGPIKTQHDVFHHLKDVDFSKIPILELTAMYREAVTTRERPPLKLVESSKSDQAA